jgi:hypothetical protein
LKRFKLGNSARLQIAAAQKYKCANLKCERMDRVLDWTFALDHKIPLRDGGSNELSNFQALCHACHAQKSARENTAHAERMLERKTRISRFFTHNTVHTNTNENTQEEKSQEPKIPIYPNGLS